MKKKNIINTIKHKKLGKLIFSASGLRKMANALQKKHKTKGDVETDCYVEKWKEDSKTKYTIGIQI